VVEVDGRAGGGLARCNMNVIVGVVLRRRAHVVDPSVMAIVEFLLPSINISHIISTLLR